MAEIQKMLEAIGYEVTVDGRFGRQTEDAVRTFQQDTGLLADGIVGPETLKALRAQGQNQVHKVRRGDSLSVLALRYGSTVADIMAANDLTDETIYIGQKLIIPATSYGEKLEESEAARKPAAEVESKGTPVMMTYQVQSGESTYVIAKRFNTTVEAIAEANGLKDPSYLRVGQKLLVPAGEEGAAVEDFAWPAMGPISSGYGWRTHPIYKNRQFHGGIDIAVPSGTDVKAAASGTVIRAGDMDGFGLGIVIDHGNGVTSWYGHNSKLLVKAGAKVVKGQVIAKSGNTGISTGPHLDFRIKVDGHTSNPLIWLP
ncbi:MAG: peptidoglycan DD-metalloendopeptidase family protein [Firmicutes bacterium]|nr:peptidoglycan DD-metalloendopeptidase family protein [Bacillota bacterium]